MDAINIDTIDICQPNISPNVNNSFMSPPPIDSFLNRKSPNNLRRYININEIIPNRICDSA